MAGYNPEGIAAVCTDYAAINFHLKATWADGTPIEEIADAQIVRVFNGGMLAFGMFVAGRLVWRYHAPGAWRDLTAAPR